jgi:hypothetical protein
MTTYAYPHAVLQELRASKGRPGPGWKDLLRLHKVYSQPENINVLEAFEMLKTQSE